MSDDKKDLRDEYGEDMTTPIDITGSHFDEVHRRHTLGEEKYINVWRFTMPPLDNFGLQIELPEKPKIVKKALDDD